MEFCYIALGSNLKDRKANINKAIGYLRSIPKIKVEKISSIIETEPQGGPPQDKFLNAVIKIKTSLVPEELLKTLQGIENKLGRVCKVKNGPRTIDLDILLYGERIIDKEDLKIPHPRMFERDFVLRPLLEVEPDIFFRLKVLRPYREKVKAYL